MVTMLKNKKEIHFKASFVWLKLCFYTGDIRSVMHIGRKKEFYMVSSIPASFIVLMENV